MSEHVLDQNNQGSGLPLDNSIYGLWGDSQTGSGVIGTGPTGVYGTTIVGTGIRGYVESGTGVVGVSNLEVGVFGRNTGEFSNGNNVGYSFGVVGTGWNAGVAAFNENNANAAYLASACCAAWFTGGVHVAGVFTADTKQFQIDHPLCADEKYLVHTSVESSEMKNIYDGVSVLDSNGEAKIALPDWFEALNGDFRYQLTAIGGPSPNLHIAQTIANGRFKIGGGIPRMQVSWQVTGVRKDAWAVANPLCVEQEKSAEERGYYLHPELYGATKERSIGLLRHPPPRLDVGLEGPTRRG